jgi:hypothetical protein
MISDGGRSPNAFCLKGTARPPGSAAIANAS